MDESIFALMEYFLYNNTGPQGYRNMSEERKVPNSGDFERHLLASIQEVVFATDIMGQVTYITPSVTEMIGLEPSILIGKMFPDLFSSDDHQRVIDDFRKSIDGQNLMSEYRIVLTSGEPRWVVVSSKPLMQHDQTIGVCGTITNIQQRNHVIDSIIRESRINAEIAQISQLILTTDGIESISKQILKQALIITGSQHGFLAYREPYSGNIITPAVTGTPEPQSDSSKHNSDGGFFSEIEKWVANQDHPLIVNSASGSSACSQLSSGKTPIHRLVSVPARIGTTHWGWIVLVNKSIDYTCEDVCFVEQVGSLYSIAVSQRLSDHSLKRSEERYRTTVDNLDDMVHVIDDEFKLILYNRKVKENAANFSGLSDSLLGRSIFEVFPFLSPEVFTYYDKVLKTGQMNRTLDTTRVNNMVVYTDAQRIPVFDINGKVIRIITILRDVTEFKRIENNLKALANDLEKRVANRTSELASKNMALETEIEQHRKTAYALDLSQELTRTLMNTPYIILLLLEVNGDVVACNDLGAKSLGSTPDQVIGKNVSTLIGNDMFNSRKGLARKLFEEKEIVQFRDQREGRWFDTTLLPVIDNNGDLVRVTVIARDITAQRRVEEEIQRSQKLESIGVLAGGIAHDFNNYLTGILGYINIVRLKTRIPDDARALLEKAEKATIESRLLAQQLLTFSKGGAPVCQTTDLREIIRESVEFSTRGSPIQCCPNLPEEPMPALVDAGQIGQVINNLILNAIHAVSGRGTLEVNGKIQSLLPDNDLNLMDGCYNLIEVIDSGMGIAPENMSRVFDPYFSTKENGSGLGLAVAHSVITNHNGVITVNSEPGQLTVFTIYLPRTRHALSDRHVEQHNYYQGTGCVLVMDDERCVREVLEMMLVELGYDVVTAANGDDAIKSFNSAFSGNKPIKAVILDLTIPGGRGGVDTLTELRKIDPDIKAIVTSGYSNDTVLADYTSYGFEANLPKPFNLSDVQEVLGEVLK